MSAYPAVRMPRAAGDPVLHDLLARLQARHRGAVAGVLLYGSCLRSGDIYDGLLDLYLLCDDYRAAYGPGLLAIANRLLPPNVFYAEQEGVDRQGGSRRLRAKVTVMSRRDFTRGCSRAWFESYIWGRFAQPTAILTARDDTVRAALEADLLRASGTLLQRALPLLPHEGSIGDLWESALSLSYGTELRTERAGRAGELVDAAKDFYTGVTRQHAASLGHGFQCFERRGELRYRTAPTKAARIRARCAWALRRVQGKLLSVLRLVKALFTFEGGLDYIAWKLERHSGEPIVIPERVRRRPLVHLWGYFWGLYRRGIFK